MGLDAAQMCGSFEFEVKLSGEFNIYRYVVGVASKIYPKNVFFKPQRRNLTPIVCSSQNVVLLLPRYVFNVDL
jgi:hypothetical protein